LKEQEYYEWLEKFEKQNNSFDKDKNIKLNALKEEIEEGITIIGATGILDTLSEKVLETIQLFKEANIKIWMMTGDKIETAINISYNCGILAHNYHLITFHHESEE
jgi:P-type E1-E2 ATPase